MEREKYFNGIEFIRLILRWKKTIGSLVIFSIILAVVFSSPAFLAPLYSSEAIIYPPATNSNKMLIDYDLRFGTDKEIDEHIQILKSGILRDTMISRYKLMSRYGISENDKAKYDELYKTFSKRFTVDRTRQNAISITVFDTNADTAALLANDLVQMGDKVKEHILKNNFLSASQSLREQYEKAESDLDSILFLIGKNDNINCLPEFNTTAKKDFAEKLADKLDLHEAKKKAREKNNQVLLSLLRAYESKQNFLTDLQEKNYEIDQKLSSTIPGSYVITPARAADRKCWPVRSLIVFIAGISALLFGICIAFVTEHVKKLKHQL
ncbi:MAG: Wzz/FepE/Etk N-terminal domain-containing protein [Bacteroidia bacterium]